MKGEALQRIADESIVATQPQQTEPLETPSSPFGRDVGERTAFGVWFVVLVLAIAAVGALQQRVRPLYSLNFHRYTIALVLGAAIALFVWLVLRFILRVGSFHALTGTAVFMLLFFRWNLVLTATRQLGLTGPIRDVAMVLVVAVVAFVLLTRSRRTAVLVLALVLAIGGLFASTVPYLIRVFVDTPPIPAVVAQPNVMQRDDILVILLDAYLREDRMAEFMDFDNSEFRTELVARGFEVDADAMSNYSRTLGTVASAMSLSLPIDEGLLTPEDKNLIRVLLGGGGRLFEVMRDGGYEVTSFVTGWLGTRCTDASDYCIEHSIVASTAWYLLETTPLAPLLKANFIHPISSVAIKQLSSLADDADRAFSRGAPQFIWAHIDLPHFPVHLTAECDVQRDRWRRGTLMTDGPPSLRPRRVVAYTEQVSCTNSLLLAELDSILAAHPNTQVLIFSDHGTTSLGNEMVDDRWTDDQLAEKFSVIAAIRAPEGCGRVLDARTLVNVFRRFVSCTLDVSLDDVEDDQFVVPLLEDRQAVTKISSFQP